MPAKLLILAFLAAAVAAAYGGGGFSASLLTLERAFPANQRVELEVLRARDRARHARILQGVVGGVVDFSVLGTSDPFLVGGRTYQSGDLTKTDRTIDGIIGFGLQNPFLIYPIPIGFAGFYYSNQQDITVAFQFHKVSISRSIFSWPHSSY